MDAYDKQKRLTKLHFVNLVNRWSCCNLPLCELVSVTADFFHAFCVIPGLCEVCSSSDKDLLIFPGYKCGSLQIVVIQHGIASYVEPRNK